MDHHSIPPSLRIKVDVSEVFQDELWQDRTSFFFGRQSIQGNDLWDWTNLLYVVVELKICQEERS